jgi:hypothetical protein
MQMAKRLVNGTCHICGEYAKLSFEHVPPRSAFNDRPALRKRIKDLYEGDLDDTRGEISQRGAGGYTLCESCNNRTGAWYGNAFVEWAYQCAHILYHTRGKASLYYQYHIFPLRVIKQILCMFFSINGSEFRVANEHLVALVLNRKLNGFEPQIGIYAYFNASGRSRNTGVAASANFNTGKVRILSEIAFPPMGYIMTFGSEPPNDKLVDISFMAKYHYNDWKSLSLPLPVLPIYTYFPGDYRDRDQVLREAEASRNASRLVTLG